MQNNSFNVQYRSLKYTNINAQKNACNIAVLQTQKTQVFYVRFIQPKIKQKI